MSACAGEVVRSYGRFPCTQRAAFRVYARSTPTGACGHHLAQVAARLLAGTPEVTVVTAEEGA